MHADHKMASADDINGVLDWEFAHAGNPLTDIANMLRPRDYQSHGFNEAFVKAYEQAAGPLPPNWQSLSRLIDLMSQMEMLDAADERPNLFGWTRDRIESTIQFITADLNL
jgi:aminoglycoside phosphotransferase (APT) family kinase protein